MCRLCHNLPTNVCNMYIHSFRYIIHTMSTTLLHTTISYGITEEPSLCNVSNISTCYSENDSNAITKVQYSFCVAYLIVAIATVFGNSLVIASIKRFKYLRTNTNIYIFFLSTSDITVSAALVYSALFVLKRKWQTLAMPCLMRYALFTYSVSSSIFLHVGKYHLYL